MNCKHTEWKREYSLPKRKSKEKIQIQPASKKEKGANGKGEVVTGRRKMQTQCK